MTDNDDKKYYDCRCGRSGNTSHEQDLGGLAIAGGYDVKLSEVHGMAQRGGSVVTYVRYGEKVAEPIVEEGRQMSLSHLNDWKHSGMHIS